MLVQADTFRQSIPWRMFSLFTMHIQSRFKTNNFCNRSSSCSLIALEFRLKSIHVLIESDSAYFFQILFQIKLSSK